jgi:hypothetical protein
MNYDPNITWGIHKVKITLQQWDHKGTVVAEVKGNCKGRSVLESAIELYEENIVETDCNFKFIDNGEAEGFHCELKNDSGGTLEIDEEWDELEDLIVGVEIIDFNLEAVYE